MHIHWLLYDWSLLALLGSVMLILLVLWMLDCWSLSECGVCDVDFAHTLDVILLFALVAAGYELLVMHVCWLLYHW